MTTIPAAIDVDVAIGSTDRRRVVRSRVLARADLTPTERRLTRGVDLPLIEDGIDFLEATAGGGATTWPVSRSYSGRKSRRLKLPVGHRHSRELFEPDVTRDGGRWGFIRNLAPYGTALVRGAYYEGTGYRRPKRKSLIRAMQRYLAGRPSQFRAARLARTVQRALRNDLREAQARARLGGR